MKKYDRIQEKYEVSSLVTVLACPRMACMLSWGAISFILDFQMKKIPENWIANLSGNRVISSANQSRNQSPFADCAARDHSCFTYSPLYG